tara:strand:+ start:12795 stop:14060 length:1266 start_codon:yes stop_codon:yes gene_type:complete
MSFFNRIFYLFIQSFKYSFREKSTFIISTLTISLCLVLVFLVSILSFYSVKKILSMDSHKLLITFKKDIEDACIDDCAAEIENMIEIDRCPTCPSFAPYKLNPTSSDSDLELIGKSRCRECIDNDYNKDDKIPSKLIEGRKMYKFICDEACLPPSGSKYPPYYGAKLANPCMDCVDKKCDQSIKYVLDKNSDMINLISAGYLNRELKNFEKLFQRSYFNSYRGKTVNLPMRAVFNIDSNVDNEDKLNKLISDVKMTENSNGEKIIDSVDVFDEQKFKYYKSLVPMILGSAFIVFLFALLIPFFIVSNTIRLIIHSKRHILSTLRLLGEKDLYIKLPFIFQGIWNGVLGGAISILCIFILDLIEFNAALYNFINKTFSVDPEYSLVSDVQFVFMDQYVFTFFILGVSLAIFGAIRACSKYLD